jgi:hypothetical protein
LKTKIINLFGGPNSGKSTIASGLFYNLKIRDINSELISEYAKIKVWEDNKKTLKNQIYLFAKQHFAINNVLNLVDFIIMDSPLLLNPIYDNNKCETFERLCLIEHNKLNNINFFINRDNKTFETSGRIHSLEESLKIDDKIKLNLKNWDVNFINVDDVDDIIDFLKKNDYI